MPAGFEIRVKVREELATALRGFNRFSRFMSRYLGPDIGRTWIALSSNEVTVGGTRLRDVRKLASRYARVDRLLQRHGLKPFELGLGGDMFPEIAGFGEGGWRRLGCSKTDKGELVMSVPVGDETIRRLQGPLLWFLSMSKAARVTIEFRRGEIRLDAPVWDFMAPVAKEIDRVERLRQGEFTPCPEGLGAVESLLWAGAAEGLRPPLRFRKRMERAAAIGDWRHANRAYELEDFWTRIRVDPETGRAKGGFTTIFESIDDEIFRDSSGWRLH